MHNEAVEALKPESPNYKSANGLTVPPALSGTFDAFKAG